MKKLKKRMSIRFMIGLVVSVTFMINACNHAQKNVQQPQEQQQVPAQNTPIRNEQIKPESIHIWTIKGEMKGPLPKNPYLKSDYQYAVIQGKDILESGAGVISKEKERKEKRIPFEEHIAVSPRYQHENKPVHLKMSVFNEKTGKMDNLIIPLNAEATKETFENQFFRRVKVSQPTQSPATVMYAITGEVAIVKGVDPYQDLEGTYNWELYQEYKENPFRFKRKHARVINVKDGWGNFTDYIVLSSQHRSPNPPITLELYQISAQDGKTTGTMSIPVDDMNTEKILNNPSFRNIKVTKVSP